jgi:hypothetical protein
MPGLLAQSLVGIWVCMVTCPSCGADDLDLVRRLDGDMRELRCTSCGHQWVRGEQLPVGLPRPQAPGDPDQVITFVDDDEGYLSWLRRHAVGYVINCYRRPSTDYLVMHLASCHTISGVPTRGDTWTSGEYAKACATRRADLLAWARAVGDIPHPCGTCDP